MTAGARATANASLIPPNIPIGTVTAAPSDPAGTITVAPVADLTALETVQVLTRVTGS